MTPNFGRIIHITQHILNRRIVPQLPLVMSSARTCKCFRTLSECSSLALSSDEDDPEIRARYRPFLLPVDLESTDWISKLELESAVCMVEANLVKTKSRLKVLVLYGSLRQRSVFLTSLAENLKHGSHISILIP
jgi:hypothetical protein